MLKRMGTRRDREWLAYLTVVLNSSQHASMKLSYNGDEFLGAAILSHDFQKAFSADSVKGLGPSGVVTLAVL